MLFVTGPKFMPRGCTPIIMGSEGQYKEKFLYSKPVSEVGVYIPEFDLAQLAQCTNVPPQFKRRHVLQQENCFFCQVEIVKKMRLKHID